MGHTARYGFRIDEYLDLEGWKVVDLSNVPLTEVPACPADQAMLKPLCTFTPGRAGVPVRLGCCVQCGHVSYIDRPAQDWIDRYYQETWDSAQERGSGEGLVSTLERVARAEQTRELATVRLAKGLPVDRALPVCEIGCGYGTSLRQLAAAGFSTLVAIEPSRHRADVTAAAGFDVLRTPFEAPETRHALHARGPFGLIFTFHALEHTYHPDAVFAQASALQEPGGHLIVSVPNQEGEPSMGVLMFLPHLHSFTPASLARLAARYGYAVADASANTAKTLNMVFTRAAVAAPVMPPEHQPYGRAVEKFASGLDLQRRHVGRRRLWWSRRADIGGQVWAGPPAAIGARNWRRFIERDQIQHPRSVLVSNLATTRSDTPLEIQFAGPVGLFFK